MSSANYFSLEESKIWEWVNKKIVDGRMSDGLTSDGRTVSDHNSTLSTECSVELKKKKKFGT